MAMTAIPVMVAPMRVHIGGHVGNVAVAHAALGEVCGVNKSTTGAAPIPQRHRCSSSAAVFRRRTTTCRASMMGFSVRSSRWAVLFLLTGTL